MPYSICSPEKIGEGKFHGLVWWMESGQWTCYGVTPPLAVTNTWYTQSTARCAYLLHWLLFVPQLKNSKYSCEYERTSNYCEARMLRNPELKRWRVLQHRYCDLLWTNFFFVSAICHKPYLKNWEQTRTPTESREAIIDLIAWAIGSRIASHIIRIVHFLL